jgi:ATP-dependent helicase HrpB
MDLPGGRSVQVVYAQDGPPSVSVILQHVYDWQANPRIAGGAVSVLVHLLSPARRPIQTTADLGRFWREGYPAVRSQLRGRYPKHEWR